MLKRCLGTFFGVAIVCGIDLVAATAFAQPSHSTYSCPTGSTAPGCPTAHSLGHFSPRQVAAAANAAAQAATRAAKNCRPVSSAHCQSLINIAKQKQAIAIAAARKAGNPAPFYPPLPSTGAGGLAGLAGSQPVMSGSIQTVAAWTSSHPSTSKGSPGVTVLPATGGAAN